MVSTRLVRWLALCQLAVSREVIPDPCGESCVSRPDAGDTSLLQTAKASGEPISSKEFAEKMQCDAQENSFSINGGDWTFVLGNFQSAGILWEDLLVSWEKGGPNKEYFGIDYTFMSQTYSFTDYLTVSSSLGVTRFPMTLWASQVIKLILPLPFPTGCNRFWKEQDFSGLYISPPWSLEELKSPGFDDAGWPRSTYPNDLIVDSLTFCITVQPFLKVLPGDSPDAPPTMEVRLQLFLELRPVFRTPGPKPTTTTTTTKPYDRRRRDYFTRVPSEVERWCRKYLRRVAHGIVLRVLVNPLWTCVDPPGLFSSIRYQFFPAYPGELSELEWFAESPKWPENLTIPAGFLFDIPDLRNLLSTAERQRVQDFKETVDEEIVPPENVSVTDGDCPVPFAIGGGCKCKVLAAFPDDRNTFRCLGTGEWSGEPVHYTVARGWCLELEGNEKVIMVRREGRDNASVQCPDGYQVVGGGCTFIEGFEFTLRESYPTSRNTWECVFDSTWSCGEGSPVCLRSEARAMCLGIARLALFTQAQDRFHKKALHFDGLFLIAQWYPD
ncbi:VDE1 [Symbiodinium sp. KB8]|nr:VDE1 [Symbiodinium sp. KB8]